MTVSSPTHGQGGLLSTRQDHHWFAANRRDWPRVSRRVPRCGWDAFRTTWYRCAGGVAHQAGPFPSEDLHRPRQSKKVTCPAATMPEPMERTWRRSG